MKKLTIALLASSTLIACNPQTKITSAPVEVTRNASFQTTGLLGYSDTEVRTRTLVNGKNATEVSGVPCEIKSSGYTAKVTTPAIVNLPSYGDGSPAIAVSCTYNGKTVSKTVSAYNYSQAQRANSATSAGAAGGGILGAVIVGAVTAATNKPRPGDIYKYDVRYVEFETAAATAEVAADAAAQ